MPRFRLMWRAILDSQRIIDELDRRGITYVTTGGPTEVQAPEHRRHQIEAEAEDEASALEKARAAITEVGADPSDIKVVDRYDD